jgi:DNA-binding MarR family transcriptional regulator
MSTLSVNKWTCQLSVSYCRSMPVDETLTPEEWALWDTWMQAQRVLAIEVERALQREVGISKAEFSVLVTLYRVPGHHLRVGDLAESLGWEKSRVSHLLTRMERRGFVQRIESGATGRRTNIGLTPTGLENAEVALLTHGRSIRRYFLDPLTSEQTDALRAWSQQLIDRSTS